MYALLIALLPSTAPGANTAKATQATPVTKRVCQDIEVPMSRMKRRVCKNLVVKQPAPQPPEAESETTNGSAQAEAEAGN